MHLHKILIALRCEKTRWKALLLLSRYFSAQKQNFSDLISSSVCLPYAAEVLSLHEKKSNGKSRKCCSVFIILLTLVFPVKFFDEVETAVQKQFQIKVFKPSSNTVTAHDNWKGKYADKWKTFSCLPASVFSWYWKKKFLR